MLARTLITFVSAHHPKALSEGREKILVEINSDDDHTLLTQFNRIRGEVISDRVLKGYCK